MMMTLSVKIVPFTESYDWKTYEGVSDPWWLKLTKPAWAVNVVARFYLQVIGKLEIALELITSI